VVTDGSGATRVSRYSATRSLLEGMGCRFGFLQGGISDRAFYDLIQGGEPAPFIEFARGLASEWREEGIQVVAGDMLEGFSTTHDICRMVINAAVEKIRKEGHLITTLEFGLESMQSLDTTSPGVISLKLDEAAFARKRQAALALSPYLAGEVERLVAKYGKSDFCIETLRTARSPAGLSWDAPEPPFYETYGRRQVAAGHYKEAITYSSHIQPLANAIWDWAVSDSL
jgi:hypothetical protein